MSKRGLDTRMGRPRERARIVDAFLEEAAADARVDFEALLVAAPESPPAALRSRLLDALAVTNRFDDLEESVAELTGLPREEAKALLLDVDRAHVWEPGPSEGVELFHFTGGEKVQGAVTGFVRIQPGMAFPDHEHVGEEHVLVLSGTLEEQSGERYHPGEIAKMPTGSKHAFRAVGQAVLLTMAIVQGGVIIGGQLIAPGDPRA